jgi:hypothetical protein
MAEPKFTLRLTLDDPFGKSYSAAMAIDAFDARDRYVGLKPPSALESELGLVSMTDVVEIIRKREYRKDDFERAARDLARLLGERMEDEEGWHGISRQERYEQERREGRW